MFTIDSRQSRVSAQSETYLYHEMCAAITIQSSSNPKSSNSPTVPAPIIPMRVAMIADLSSAVKRLKVLSWISLTAVFQCYQRHRHGCFHQAVRIFLWKRTGLRQASHLDGQALQINLPHRFARFPCSIKRHTSQNT